MPQATVHDSWEAVFSFEFEEAASFTSLKKLLWERKERMSQTRGLSVSHALSGPWAWVPNFLEGLGGSSHSQEVDVMGFMFWSVDYY